MRGKLAALGVIGVLAVSACTSSPADPVAAPSSQPAAGPAPAFKLVAFDSCDELLRSLRDAAKEAVGPWGFGGSFHYRGDGGPEGDLAAADSAKAAAPAGGGQTHSTTNTHEAGVDEPDLVKTDGQRIVVIAQGSLKVVDAASRAVTGSLTLGTADEQGKSAVNVTDLLLSGDRALVLGYDYQASMDGSRGVSGAQVTLVDLSGAPKVIGKYTIDGGLLDARQIGSTARVVVTTRPQIAFPTMSRPDTDEARIAANRSAIQAAPVEAWLPGWKHTDAAGKVTTGQVDCGAVSRPTSYSATSVLTVLTFDLAAPALGTGDAVSVVADGDTVYANGPSLYIANDQRWRIAMWSSAKTTTRMSPPPARTQVFKFDLSGAAKPRFAASGEVSGWLLNQYSMSEWDGHLRIATTDSIENTSSSTVFVLRQNGGQLTEAGKVGGLGKGERIYSVRFIGTAGYVVTFRQTDPLYTLDLRDPAAPRVVGELKITGYSAYLHPAGPGRLLGLGQEANNQGRTQGTQLSLFDISDPAKPGRIAQYQRPGAHSEAEHDPHAFLYWEPLGIVVVPVWTDRRPGAIVLKVAGTTITEAGQLTHPGQHSMIRRSLIVGGTLWTVSDHGLKANDAATLAEQAWLPM